LIEFNGYPAYDGPCTSIPASASLNFTFPGLNAGQSVNISIPLRNYARGISDYLGDNTKCALSLDVGEYNDCILAAPFSTAMFLAINDEKNQIALAQGGVSTGAQLAGLGLGTLTTIKKGGSLPAV